MKKNGTEQKRNLRFDYEKNNRRQNEGINCAAGRQIRVRWNGAFQTTLCENDDETERNGTERNH